MNIPQAAVDAAAKAHAEHGGETHWEDWEQEVRDEAVADMRAGLEAAYQHLLSHEREETRLAHVDAVVNAQSVDKLQAKLDRAEALAAAWEARGEHDMKVSTSIRDEYIATEILGHGAQMVENARHIRNAIGS